MHNNEMLVIKKGFDFSKWLLNHTGKYPKSYRFSVAAKLETAILDFSELTTVANMRKDKLPLLKKADEKKCHCESHFNGRSNLLMYTNHLIFFKI